MRAKCVFEFWRANAHPCAIILILFLICFRGCYFAAPEVKLIVDVILKTSMNDSDQAGATPQKVDVSAQTDVPTDVMEPVKKADALTQTEEMTDILAILECPVCLEDIQKPPIYICENAQGHSICAKCHKTLKNERKPCPTCKAASRRQEKPADRELIGDSTPKVQV